MATTEWRGTSDHNVTETAFDAVKCKLSAVTLGYFEDPFLRYFVEKPTRRIPLIHRGYYLRHVAITRCVELFLSQYASESRVNIMSLGAGFDTLYFRLLQQRYFAGSLNFIEVDCEAIVSAKAQLLNNGEVRAGLFPNDINDLAAEDGGDMVAWHCRVPSATYSLIECDLGDVNRLDTAFNAAGVERNLPTLILAECVLSYLAPEKGTLLLRWLADSFPSGSVALYDPIGLHANQVADCQENADNSTQQQQDDSSAFGTTLQRYFAVKGCTLRGVRGFQTAADYARRMLALAHWQRCRILDMNGVFEVCASADEKRRLSALEPFDEYADWVLCNAHYAIYLADNAKGDDNIAAQWTTRFVPSVQQHRLLLSATVLPESKNPSLSDVAIIRSFQQEDLAAVRSLFESTHLEFAQGSRAVRQFVANRLRGPSGDMFDVKESFQTPNKTGIMDSGFWVAEVNGEVVGCVGVKPLVTASKQRSGSSPDEQRAAELCRLSVSPAYRRCGLASSLVGAVEAFASSFGAYREIRLETIGVMKGAQNLYRALGYVELVPGSDKHHSSSFTLVRFQKSL
ncbi:hypothetical protein PHYBOEH_009994 [Phytophthora boehmeriae]|uniref:N-acetyltransferase domain-containing protein n=1 Tax=Phytophthora boehmeriae TaxID=109152 RepID=A0A8T1X0C5_9STRA|nr:hypothetical protein PHYBOEH_009994 [Phytophthora boehmeriae]